MCDYSLGQLASRPATVGDTLVTTHFRYSLTGGFCAIGAPNVAVCVKPGTELVFEREIETLSKFWMRRQKFGAKVARFRHVNLDCPTMHHDAIELPSGEIVLLTRLCEGQFATVIQLPIRERQHEAQENNATATGGLAATSGDASGSDRKLAVVAKPRRLEDK
jgi:hypothetical protein